MTESTTSSTVRPLLRQVCAWCPQNGRAPKVLREGVEPTSHGICDECAVVWRKKDV